MPHDRLSLSHTLQDIQHEFKEHNSELDLLNQLVTVVWPYAEMDQGSLYVWKIIHFLVWMVFQLDLFSAMSCYVFSHTGINRDKFGGEGDRMILKLLWSFTSFTLICCCVWHLLQAYRTKNSMEEYFLDYQLICASSSLIWIPKRSGKCRLLFSGYLFTLTW